jgi:hypothetical protein
MLWALIVDGAVREITDTDPAGRYHPSLHWQPCDGEVREGDLWTGTAFALPLPVDIRLPRTVPALAFRRRFTPEERAAITLAASRALEANDATLQVWLDDLNSAAEVHLDTPEIAAALDMLVANGLLAPERKVALLA